MNKDILTTVGPLMGRFCGLGIKMINDKVRNKFYDELLKKCEGKKCIEVGGGSGILTFIALKHGAKHVTCFEMEKKVYDVLSDVVSYCGMSDKVTLINEKFKSSRSIEKYNLKEYDLLFHELFGDNIWNDLGWPIRSTFDERLSIPIIPNKCISDFYFIEIFDWEKIKNTKCDFYLPKIPEFSPGVEIDDLFVNYYSSCIDFYNENHLEEYECLVKKINLNTFFSEVKIPEVSKVIKKHHSFCFDLNSSDYMQTTIKFDLPNLDNPYVFFPIHRVGSDDDILRLDNALDSWDHPGAYLISSKKKDVIFEMDMLNGTIKINDIVVSSGSPLWYY
jgi:hypothetical protein